MEDKWWQKDSTIPEELNDVPIIENKTTNIKNSDWEKLHYELAEKVINFFKEHGLPKDAYVVNFGFDSLKESVEYGEWCPISDSSLILESKNRETILFSM